MTTLTDCDATRPFWAWLPRGAGTTLAPASGAPVPARETRAYFRCHPLHATVSVEQCRANRARYTPDEALALPFDIPPWWVQPLACWSCTLARAVEAGRVPFYSAEDVLAGRVPREAPAPGPAPTLPTSAAPPLVH